MNRPLIFATAVFAGTVWLASAPSEAQVSSERLMRSDTAAPAPSARAGAQATQSQEPMSAPTSRMPSIGEVGQVNMALPGIAPGPQQRSATEPLTAGDRPVASFGAAPSKRAPAAEPHHVACAVVDRRQRNQDSAAGHCARAEIGSRILRSYEQGSGQPTGPRFRCQPP